MSVANDTLQDNIWRQLSSHSKKMQDGYAGEATGWLKRFNKECKKALKEGNDLVKIQKQETLCTTYVNV